MELDPSAADIPARARRPVPAAEQGAGGDGRRRAGAEDRAGQSRSATACSARSTPRCRRAAGDGGARPRRRARPTPTSRRRFSTSSRRSTAPVAESDPNVRATLARLYVRSDAYDKAIPLLTDLVNQEPGWQDGPLLLVEAYAGAGRSADAIAWLEERTADDPRLCRRWPISTSASGAGPMRPAPTRARCSARRATPTCKIRYASALMNAGGRDNVDKARDALTEVVAGARRTDVRALYLLSQAQRRLGEFTAAEATARRSSRRTTRARGATTRWPKRSRSGASIRRSSTRSRRSSPTIRGKSADDAFASGMLLPHLGFAYRSSGSTTRRSRRSRRRASSRRTIRRSPAI